MPQKFTGMLNLSKCNNKTYLKHNKAGETVIYFDMWINDTADKFGNTVSFQISQTKEQREAGKIYIGNAKPNESKQPEQPAQSNKAPWES